MRGLINAFMTTALCKETRGYTEMLSLITFKTFSSLVFRLLVLHQVRHSVSTTWTLMEFPRVC